MLTEITMPRLIELTFSSLSQARSRNFLSIGRWSPTAGHLHAGICEVVASRQLVLILIGYLLLAVKVLSQVRVCVNVVPGLAAATILRVHIFKDKILSTLVSR